MNIGLYLHIPFCRQKCLYCDFPSVSQMEHLYQSYTEALRREIAGQGLLFSDCAVNTIYIGGGTPTILPQSLLLSLIQEVKNSFFLDPNNEFSIEVNPGTVTGDTLTMLKSAGINRVSFGIQSFDDEIMHTLGRIHNAKQGIDTIRLAQQSGFQNISMDLMFDLPGQTIEHWHRSLKMASTLGVKHISAYGLKIEDETPFAQQLEQGILQMPADDEQEAMYDLTNHYLPEKGYIRYEISNYARPGYECRHNLKYWTHQSYLGLGAAAHSFIKGNRIANVSNINQYIKRISSNCSVVEFQETPKLATAMAEFCFLALRTINGLSLVAFHNKFGIEFEKVYDLQLKDLVQKGLLDLLPERARLTELGMKFGNQVFCVFLP